MMSFAFLFTICVIILVVLAFFLNYNWGDKVNGLQKAVIVIGLFAIAFFSADNLKSNDDDETAHLTTISVGSYGIIFLCVKPNH